MLEREGHNCLGIGIIDAIIYSPELYPEFYLGAMSAESKVIAAVWMTPPHPLGITDMPIESLGAVVDFARSLPNFPSGVVGPAETTARLVELFAKSSAIKIRSKMAQRIYELRKVEFKPKVPGVFRCTAEGDRELLESWSLRFAIDCGLHYDPVKMKDYASAAIKYRTRFFWEVEGIPVSMVGVGGNTPNGIRVNWVYTPPEQRGRGYASAIVAEVSQLQFNLGKKLCFLYTDLANPTSNSIYQRIGYRPVGDSVHYSFL
jgi:predicted GNAT family acetyltransferase